MKTIQTMTMVMAIWSLGGPGCEAVSVRVQPEGLLPAVVNQAMRQLDDFAEPGSRSWRGPREDLLEVEIEGVIAFRVDAALKIRRAKKSPRSGLAGAGADGGRGPRFKVRQKYGGVWFEVTFYF